MVQNVVPQLHRQSDVYEEDIAEPHILCIIVAILHWSPKEEPVYDLYG